MNHFLHSDQDSFQYDSDFIQTQLNFYERFALGSFGISLALYGSRRRDMAGLFFFGAGLGAILRAVTNIETAQLFGLVLHPVIRIKRTIDINAPVEVVFDFWKNFSNYSHFMSYVKSVTLNEKYGFTWTVKGPAGIPIHWDSNASALIPNQLLAWKSLPGALITNAGQILFDEIKPGYSTRLKVNLSYSPAAGILGYNIIKLLGFDPRDRIDNDLQIMKSLVEQAYQGQDSHQIAL